jgi:type II secretory pathway pseudopilin PulG
MKKHNLSLTEMLVVVGVIILLFSLGVPATIKAMQRGEMTECKGNLKQLSQATAVYLKDNMNYFPSVKGDSWISSSSNPVAEYVGSSIDRINVCPSNPDENESYRAAADGSDSVNDLDLDPNLTNPDSSYHAKRGMKLSKIKRPETMALFFSKEIFDEIGESTDSPDITNTADWHGSYKYPFISVSGALVELTFTNADITIQDKTPASPKDEVTLTTKEAPYSYNNVKVKEFSSNNSSRIDFKN